MRPRRDFRSKAAYHKWLAYDKMHVAPGPSPNPVDVEIRGKPHHVNHCPHCHLANGNRCGEHCR